MARLLCVFCRRAPVEPAWRPFCSERCRLQDLARWAEGAYRVPAQRVEEADQGGDRELETRKDEAVGKD